MSRIDFYKKYYENLTPSTLNVSKNENKIQISGFENSNNEYFMQSFEKGGETGFNPDGAIKGKVVHASGKAGGMLVGKRHSEGGIKAINKSTGQPIEMEGGEVVITRNAVSDNTKRSFNGKMMTNRQILSAINESGGGVSFANGGQVPNNVTFDCNAEYEYGGKTMCGKDLAYAMGGVTNYSKGVNDVIDVFLKKSSDEKYFGDFDDLLVNGKVISKNRFRPYISNNMVILDSDYGWLAIKENNTVKIDFGYGSSVLIDDIQYLIQEKAIQNGLNVKVELQKILASNSKYYIKNGLIALNPNYAILEIGGVTTAIVTDPNEAMADLQATYGYGDVYKKGGAVDDDFSDILSAVQTVDVMEDGGETPQDTAKLIKEVDDFKRKNPYLLNNIFFNSDNPSFSEIKGEHETKDGRFLQFKANTYFELISYFKEILDSGIANITYSKGREYNVVTISMDDQLFSLNLTKDGRNSKKLFNPITGSLYNFLVHFYFENKDYMIERFDWTEFILYSVPSSTQTTEEESKTETEVKSKIDYDKLKKYLRARINALSTELNIKSVALSIDEIGIYQREIRELITRYRQLIEQERENISLLDRLKSAYSVKWGDITKEYEPADLVSINGKKTELTEQEYLTVRTENFKSFFGDWEKAYETNNYTDVSKVLNEKTKEPLAVFHGTNVLFTNWKTYETNNAHYFTKKRAMAKFFATSWDSRGDKAGVDSQIIKKLNPNKGEFIYRCFLDIKNPIDFSRFGVEKRPVMDYLNFLKINYNIQDFDFWSNINKGFDVKQETLVYAWQIIRAWQQFTVYVKIYTPYDGYIFYEFIPDSAKQDINDASLSFCTFDSNQVKFADAVEFNALSDDSRLKYGGIL